MSENQEQTYTPKEAATLLKVTTQTVRFWIRDGRIEATKIGRTIRIPASQIKKLIGG